MRRLALVVLAFATIGCAERISRAELAREVAKEDAAAWSRTGSAYAPVAQRWRFAGTKGGEHVVVFRSTKGDRTFALPASELALPAMAYTKDESRWIPLKEVRRVRADGSFDLDFVRLPATDIDAGRDPALRADAVRKGGL
jgi:hypothetical protein